jgi:hypothetical protein
MYHKDDYISDSYIEERILWYERKIDMLDKWQHGKDLYTIQKDMQAHLYPVSGKYSQTSDSVISYTVPDANHLESSENKEDDYELE